MSHRNDRDDERDNSNDPGASDDRDHPDDAALIASIMLNQVPGIGSRLHAVLIESFGSAADVLKASTSELLGVPGIGAQLASAIRNYKDRTRAEDALARCRASEIRLLLPSCSEYPRRLLEIADPPQLLYVRGTLNPEDDLSIAIVGSRRCTTYGVRMAKNLAGGLARAGFTVVSGLARGIDAAAHMGALAAGGRTLAVLATGVESIYPPEHGELALKAIRSGAIVSEFPLEQRPTPGVFPQRNRIISGLCLGTIVVEAGRRSGALYTARHAMEQGREVFAVPGTIDSRASDGCHDLIRDGVTLIRGVDDVIEGLGPLPIPGRTATDETVHSPRELTLNDQEREILNLVEAQPTSIDVILQTTQLDASRVLATVTILEMKRMIRRLPGNMLVRVS